MTKKFAIVLALFLVSIVCCAGCIGPGEEPVDPVDPVVPVDPIDPITPVDPVDPVVPVEEYSVMFMLNYGDAGAYTAETVKAGETVSKPANPTRSGYTFKGWFTAAEGGVEYDFTQAVNADVTLYAQWKKKSSSSSGGHSHNWGTGSVTTPATCVAEGVKTYTCSCGQTKTEVISATGQHSYGDWNSGVRTCIVCTTATETCQHPTTQVSGADVVCTICTMTIGQLSTMVAEINGNYYGSFASAMDNAADDDTIKLLATVTGGEVTKKVVIDTNDNETSLKYDDGVLEIDDIKIVCSTASDLGTVMFGDEEVVFVVDGSDNYVSGSDGNLIVAYTVKGSTYTVYAEENGLQMALDATDVQSDAEVEYVVNLAVDEITSNVNVAQNANVKITIDGNSDGDDAVCNFKGIITIDGKSATYTTAGLTIKNINFSGKTSAGNMDAYIRLGGTNTDRYVCGVTVQNCVFDGTNMVAVKSYTGGDHDLTLDTCTVNEGMHSLAQLKNVEKNLQVKNCFVYSKNGLNVNNGNNLEMSDCIFDVQGYAVRFGSDTGVYDRLFSIRDSTLKSACAESGDAVIEFRAGAVAHSTLTLTNTALDGATKFKGASAATIIIIDGVRWSEYMYVDEDGSYCISTPEALFAFAKSVNTDDETYSGKTVKLTADIDLKNKEWTPIGQTDATEFKGTFDGQGYTIKNLNIDSSEQTGGHYSSGLFGWIESHAQDITIKNVKIDGAKVTGHHNVAVIAGYLEGDSVVENCHVSNAELTNTHANDDACGDKTGVIAGYAAGGVTIKDCTAKDCTLTIDGRDAGQLLGASYVTPLGSSSVTNVVVSQVTNPTCTKAGQNINNEVIGRDL